MPVADLLDELRGTVVSGLDDATGAAVLSYLHGTGEVLFFEGHPELEKTVIIDPQWFGTALIGRIFAPSSFAATVPRPARQARLTPAKRGRTAAAVPGAEKAAAVGRGWRKHWLESKPRGSRQAGERQKE